jgi:glucose-1-phosphate cytidylyltransferase
LKAVILAGGLGTRISEETNNKPKPMVKIGPYTLLEHIMHTYSKAGIDEFIIATGYLHKIIENYFKNYKDFKVNAFFTGEHTQTGGRIKRVMQEFNKETLCVTYGDGLGNIDIRGSLKFHHKHGKLATVTAVRPTARFGRLTINKDSVVKFGEKMQSEEGWINGGFFILDSKVSEYISGDEMPFESNPLKILTEKNQLMAFKHLGFWSPVDTLREKNELEELWKNNNAPWVI